MSEAEIVAVLRSADPRFGPVVDTLLELADDDTVSPEVYDRVCAAVFAVLNAWSELYASKEPFVAIVATLALYGERANLKALIAKARELNQA